MNYRCILIAAFFIVFSSAHRLSVAEEAKAEQRTQLSAEPMEDGESEVGQISTRKTKKRKIAEQDIGVKNTGCGAIISMKSN